jgi:hypothetical protein
MLWAMRLPRILRAPLSGAGLIVLAAAIREGVSLLLRRLRHPRVATALIDDPAHSITESASGAVRSVQAADVIMPTHELDRIWSPVYLERLARTYWRFLTHATLGLVRVTYVPGGRQIVLLTRPFVLLSFREPQYEMETTRGLVRWPIERGVLVSRRGRCHGYLQIDVRRQPAPISGQSIAHVEVEVSNFYPAIATAVSDWLYRKTQSRIHVLVTHAFLRSLARLDFEESIIGRFAEDPVVQTESAAGSASPDPADLAGAPREAGLNGRSNGEMPTASGTGTQPASSGEPGDE